MFSFTCYSLHNSLLYMLFYFFGRWAKIPKVDIFLKKVDGVSYLLCKSDGRKEKESAMRNKIEEKLV